MVSVSRFLTNKLRLKVNEAKSAVARPEERKFLGFSISNDGSERRIAPKALAKFKAQIRDMTRRTRGISLPQIVKDLAPYLLGWRGYFGFCQTPTSAHQPGGMDPSKATIVSLAAMAKRPQPLQRTAPAWCAEVPCSGRRRFADRILAHVRTPGGPTGPAQPVFRQSRSSPPLRSCPRLTRSNRRGTDPYARWCGRVAPRGVPLSRSSTQRRPSAFVDGPLAVRRCRQLVWFPRKWRSSGKRPFACQGTLYRHVSVRADPPGPGHGL